MYAPVTLPVALTRPPVSKLPVVVLETHGQIKIIKNEWHRLYNPYDTPCRIVEIQYGEECNEEDIERKE